MNGQIPNPTQIEWERLKAMNAALNKITSLSQRLRKSGNTESADYLDAALDQILDAIQSYAIDIGVEDVTEALS